jgi:hypothetical protein
LSAPGLEAEHAPYQRNMVCLFLEMLIQDTAHKAML